MNDHEAMLEAIGLVKTFNDAGRNVEVLRGVAPMLRRIAMSPRLSRTTIISVDTMLNAATAITSDRITNMIVFWSWIERKYV